ncbi:MAG: glutamate--tRNA ligase, partial [Pyramidobacter sp.]|nr:glutamate--tRNA ligase [Pyramidobacter sp.]
KPANPETMLAFAREWCEGHGAKLKDVAMPLRFMLTGYKVSPGIFEVVELLGYDEVARRLKHYGIL